MKYSLLLLVSLYLIAITQPLIVVNRVISIILLTSLLAVVFLLQFDGADNFFQHISLFNEL